MGRISFLEFHQWTAENMAASIKLMFINGERQQGEPRVTWPKKVLGDTAILS